MKKIIMMALAAILALGTTMCSQSSEKGKECASTEECSNKDCCTESTEKGCVDSQNSSFSPFDGLGLTEEQEAQINEVKAAFVPLKKACLAEAKENPEKKQELCQLQRDCMAKMKEILTPTQYDTFLENLVIAQILRN